MELNPYQAPATVAALNSRPPHTLDCDGRDLMRDWEYRRLWFNAILITVTMLIGTLANFLIFERRFWTFAIEGAIGANVCFCVGPVVTWYLSRLGFNHRAAGALLFFLGTALSVVLTVISIFFNLIPFQD
jgi:hypothetical protein